jgi:hypothetical protein
MHKLGAVALAAVVIVLLVASASCSSGGNPWTAVTVRERRSGEIPFEESSGYLRPSSNRNYVPGPDSLVARVDTDTKGHPHILIERDGTGQADTLFGGWASLPQWSPDGRFISCVAWKSRFNPYQLTVVDVATKSVVLESSVKANGTESKWSPDSRTIVAAGVSRGSSWVVLYTVGIPSGKTAVLDSVNVLVAHDMSWSPDSRWVAFSRPTKLDRFENVEASDLWIADVLRGKAWPLLETSDWIESNPRWITNRSIQVDRRRTGDDTIEKTDVVELRNAED